MRRSTLQRKDRDELTQIAEALGRKPPSRARKGEIIDLILDLADGGDGSSVVSESNGSDNEGDSDGAAADEDSADATTAGAVDTSTAESSSADSDESTDEAGDDDDGGRSDRHRDDAEPGNRRRRRRGRDRDRDKDDSWDGEPVAVAGNLDLRDEGYGFLRVNGSLPSKNDAYVSVKTIRSLGLRRGDHVTGTSRPANRTEKNPALLSVESINGGAAEATDRPLFDDLTAVHADRQLQLEQPDDPDNLAARVIDLIAPIGLGQRVLVHAPRRSGGTAILKSIVQSIETNEPDVQVIGLALDQRPEDITELSRWVQHGEVAATSFDQSADEHIQTAEMTVERAKRIVEQGRDVVVVIDGLTALARAYNTSLSNSGRAYIGNVEAGAVHMPKKVFGAGRNIEDGASLTMIAAITADSGDVVDDVVYGEFAGTANTDIRLDRWAAERDIHPAIDVTESTSHDEERFLDDGEKKTLDRLRSSIASNGADGPGAAVAQLETLLERLASNPTNADLLR